MKWNFLIGLVLSTCVLRAQFRLEINTTTSVVNGIEQGSVFNRPIWQLGGELYYSAGASEHERDIYLFTPGISTQPERLRQRLKDTCSNIAFGPIELHDALYFFNVYYQSDYYGVVKYTLGSDSLTTFLPLGDSLVYCPDLEADFQNNLYISLLHKSTGRHRVFRLDEQNVVTDLTSLLNVKSPTKILGVGNHLFIADSITLVQYDGTEVTRNAHFQIEYGLIIKGENWLITSEKNGSLNVLSVFNPHTQTLTNLPLPLPNGLIKPQFWLSGSRLLASGLDPKALIGLDTATWEVETVCDHSVSLVGASRSFAQYKGKILITDRVSSNTGFECVVCDELTQSVALLSDINPGTSSSMPRYYVELMDRLYFFADDGVHGNEIWSLGDIVLQSDYSPNTSSQISIYPNPVTQILNVTDRNRSITDISVFDSLGQKVKLSTALTASETERLDLTNLEPGFYFINIQHGTGSASYSVVKI